jgi:hypothetical protein
MTIDKQVLVPFSPHVKPKFVVEQFLPKGAKFLKVALLPDGIYAFYGVPTILPTDADGNIQGETFTFALYVPNESPIYDTDEFIDIITAFSELTPEECKERNVPVGHQVAVIYSIFLRSKQ